MKTTRIRAPFVNKLKFAKFHKGRIASAIIDAYSSMSRSRYAFRPQPPAFPETVILSNTPQCLGDFMTLTDLPRAAKEQNTVRFTWSPRVDGETLFRTFVPEWTFPQDRTWFTDGQSLIYNYNCGNGHLLQKLRRVFRLQVDERPCGRLHVPAQKLRDRVILHFDAGADHKRRQRDEFHFHPRPRELYETSKVVIEQFIRNNPQLEFVEVGHKSQHVRGAQHVVTETVSDLIKLIATGSWFVGVLSGPLHVATALGLRCIGIINFPFAHQVVLPVLRPTGVPEEEWLYPQHVWLHQDNGSALVPKFSLTSLEAAFGGDVYPFWDDAWLPLINEDMFKL